MDKKEFEARAARLKEVNEVIAKLEPVIQEKAFHFLAPYIDAEVASQVKAAAKDIEVERLSDGDFFSKHDHDKAADNVYLLAAWFYLQYGISPFSLEELKAKGHEVGLTLPARPDSTLNQAKKGGKALFMTAGKGKYKPTVHGETHLKTTYSITKGTKPKPETKA